MRTERLGDVAELIRGVSFDGPEAAPHQSSGYLPILRAGNIQDRLDTAGDLVWVPEKRVSPVQRLVEGDIAICMSSGSPAIVGKTAILSRPFDGSVGAFCGIVRPLPSQVDGRYLAFWLRSPAFWAWRDAQSRGVGIQNLRLSQLAELIVPVPSLEMQRDVATLLTDVTAAADRVRSAAHSRGSAVDALRAAAYRSFLAGSEFDSWPFATVASLLASPLRTGVSGAPSTTSPVRGLSLAAVRRGRLDLTQSRPVAVDPSTDRLVREGRFYVVRGNGRLDLVGRAGLAPRSDAHVVFPDLLIEMHMDPTKVHPEYLQLIWDGREVRSDIESRARTASGIHKINLGNLAQVVVPLPPMETQRRIASELRARLDAIDTAVAATDEELEAIEALPAALLRRAFNSVA